MMITSPWHAMSIQAPSGFSIVPTRLLVPVLVILYGGIQIEEILEFHLWNHNGAVIETIWVKNR